MTFGGVATLIGVTRCAQSADTDGYATYSYLIYTARQVGT